MDKHGGCESLRRYVGPGTKLMAGELVWMTDRTPHEALVQSVTSGAERFFIRMSELLPQHRVSWDVDLKKARMLSKV